MAQKMTGALVFDERTDRYDIRFDLKLEKEVSAIAKGNTKKQRGGKRKA